VQRVYLQVKVQSHRVWQNMRLWESVVFDSMRSDRQAPSDAVSSLTLLCVVTATHAERALLACMCCAVLCCAVLCCAVLCCAVLCWCGVVWCGVVWCGVACQDDRDADRDAKVRVGQLGFFCYNMLKFNVSPENVILVMQKYAQFVKMSRHEWEVCGSACFALVHRVSLPPLCPSPFPPCMQYSCHCGSGVHWLLATVCRCAGVVGEVSSVRYGEQPSCQDRRGSGDVVQSEGTM
jgi:hypothetical protein